MKTLITFMIWLTILVALAGGLNCRGGVMYVPRTPQTVPQEDLEEAAEIVNKCLHDYDGEHHDVLSHLGEFQIHQEYEFVCHGTTVLGCFIPPARVEFTMNVTPLLKAKRVKASVLPHELLHLAIFHMGNITADFGHDHPCFKVLERRQLEALCEEHEENMQNLYPTQEVACRFRDGICGCSLTPKQEPAVHCHKPQGGCK